ncbi:MAG: cytochrome C oxidase subunit IV family protein [Longimicrobiales bacterium]
METGSGSNITDAQAVVYAGTTDAGSAGVAHAADRPEAHRAPRYFVVWVALFVLTIAEVGVAFFSGMPKAALVLILLALALWKALLVALYYMHLRFEPRKLWLLALSPAPLIVILIGVVLLEAW